MARWVKIALQVVLFFLLLGTVVGLGSPDTGAAEKAVLAAVLVGLVVLTARIRRIGGPRSA
jgi:hypothetical protein